MMKKTSVLFAQTVREERKINSFFWTKTYNFPPLKVKYSGGVLNSMGKIIDITGQKFGYLTVLYPGRKYNRFAWVCKCDCGNEITVESNNLRTGKV